MSNFLRAMFVLCGMFGVQNVSATQPNVNGTIDCSNATDTQFVPSWGRVEVSADQYGKYIIQWMYWHDAARLQWFASNGDSTFEPDAFFSGYGSGYPEPAHPINVAPAGPGNSSTAYGYFLRNVSYNHGDQGYWNSDLPGAYQDTDWQIPGTTPSLEWAVTVGSAQAASLVPQRVYFTVTRMFDGGANFGRIKLSSQRGRRAIPAFPTNVAPYDKWNSYGCSGAPNNVFTLPWEAGVVIPGCRQYNYLWNITSHREC